MAPQITMGDSEPPIIEMLISDKSKAYFTALGEFVTVFSMLEVGLQTIIWHYAGLASPIAQTILPGIRTDAAMSYLKRISEVQQWDTARCDLLTDLFQQLGEINKLRNDILHYGARTDGSADWIVTNKLFAHIPEKVRTRKISSIVLRQASVDIAKIYTHLLVMTWGDQIAAAERAKGAAILAAPWRYKSPLLTGDPHRNPDTPPKRKRPRRPSRGKPPVPSK